MFYLIQAVLLAITFIVYYFPQKKFAGKVQRITFAEIIYYSVCSWFLSNAVVFLFVCFMDGRTPLLVYSKLSHCFDWRMFSLKFVMSFFVATFLLMAFFYFFKFRLSSRDVTKSKTVNFVLYAVSFVVLFGAFALLLGTFWCKGRFPMDSPEIVYYTMGNEANIVDYSIFTDIAVFVSLSVLLSVFFIFVPVAIAKHIKTHSVCISFFSKQIYAASGHVFVVLSLAFCVFIIVSSAVLLHPFEYVKIALSKTAAPVESEFYKSEYVEPRLENIVFPEQKKNLIIVFLESMESSYADFSSGGLFETNLIPHLTDIAKENINFSNSNLLGGGIDVAGTGWTVAGMLSKFSGLPFQISRNRNNTENGFLPKATTLTDILAQNGYRQRFLFGSKKHFASRDLLLEPHGSVEIHDIDWYKSNGLLEKNYHAFWGFEDSKLYEFAKYELDDLSRQSEPFMLGLLTVDTHMPEGYICSLCDASEKWQMKNVISCADRQIANFLDWAKKQSWYDDTLIVLVGDHLFMTGDNTDFFKDEKNDDEAALENASPFLRPHNERRWINIFINAEPVAAAASDIFHDRNFSSFDIFPTVISALGCEIKGNRLGLGTDLFSGEKTLVERYKLEYINHELTRKNIQYQNMAKK